VGTGKIIPLIDHYALYDGIPHDSLPAGRSLILNFASWNAMLVEKTEMRNDVHHNGTVG
jgi:hypothetical protein